MNAILFSLALPFIYLISRRVVTPKTAMFISMMALLGPINSYTAYYIPESMYFTSFWIFAWFMMTKPRCTALVFGSGIGIIIGIMSLIKVHALVLVPVVILYLFLILYYRLSEMTIRKSILIISYMTFAFLLVRCSLGYTIAGHHGLSLIGSKYLYNATSAISVDRLLSIIYLIKIPFVGHISAIALLFSVPVAIIVTDLHTKHSDSGMGESVKTIHLFTISCIIPLFFMTIFTTAQIVGWDAYETIGRIHMRYYDFIFPLFIIIAAAELSTYQTFYLRNCVVALIICVASLYAMMFLQDHYLISFIDCPELFGFIYHPAVFICLSTISLACMIIWCVRRKWGAAMYVLIFLPLTGLVSNYFVHFELRQERLYTADAYDQAGQFARKYLGDDTSHLAIVGLERGGLYKALFYIDNPKTKIAVLPVNTPVEFAKIPKDNTWLLVIGDYPVLRKPLLRIDKQDYSLIKLR